MGLKDITPKIVANSKRYVQHQTWGHLFPKKGKVFIGKLRVAESDYGDYVILKDDSNVDSSPWWYSSLNDFVLDFLRNQDSVGSVFEIKIKSYVINTFNCTQEIKIENLGYKIILK